ncbi:hypothetical protein CRUP_028197, partial [Coryphaenoides rupestris]
MEQRSLGRREYRGTSSRHQDETDTWSKQCYEIEENRIFPEDKTENGRAVYRQQLCAVPVVLTRSSPYDFIEIRDGASESADVLGRHCSNIAPPPVISSGPSLQIRFVSDYAHQGAGFSLRYEIFKT